MLGIKSLPYFRHLPISSLALLSCNHLQIMSSDSMDVMVYGTWEQHAPWSVISSTRTQSEMFGWYPIIHTARYPLDMIQLIVSSSGIYSLVITHQYFLIDSLIQPHGWIRDSFPYCSPYYPCLNSCLIYKYHSVHPMPSNPWRLTYSSNKQDAYSKTERVMSMEMLAREQLQMCCLIPTYHQDSGLITTC